MTDLWHKNTVVYCLDVETFVDQNGDGMGDFEGLTGKLDYLAGLNINCVWLQPFYPSPNRDNGYDITDYYGVDPRLGTLGDFVEFSHKAHERGIRVVIDLVVNHTSIDHPWFQASRRDPNSAYRDYYVWSREEPADACQGMVFPGQQETTWTYDEEAQAYYFHRFYAHQPELNITNPAVRREIEKIIGFWLQLGVSGFRVDALPFLIELKGIPGTDGQDPYEYLRELRYHLSWLRGDAVLMAEANLPPEEVSSYFDKGDKMHVVFNFYVNQHLFLALAREDATPIRGAYDALPAIPPFCQWANFLRTHDELDLGRLSDAERTTVYQAFGPEKHMQLYGRGIRRRLAPMLGNDRRRLELAHSLLLTLPGTPVLRYGDEIGMGDDLSLAERNSVRTPMQWSGALNAGFSTAPAEKLVLPVITSGDLGYEHVNVATQQCDPHSFLNWLERAVRERRRCPEFGSGQWQWLETQNPAVLAHRCSTQGSSVLAVHNLSSRHTTVTVDVGHNVACLYDLLADRLHAVEPGGRHPIELEPYGYRWFHEECTQAGFSRPNR